MKSLLKDIVHAKFAARYYAGTILVLLQPGFAKAFPNEQAINKALRLVIGLTKTHKKASVEKICFVTLQTIKRPNHSS
jgi:hypothetical protein